MDLLDPFPVDQEIPILFVQFVAALAACANLESALFASFSFLEDVPVLLD